MRLHIIESQDISITREDTIQVARGPGKLNVDIGAATTGSFDSMPYESTQLSWTYVVSLYRIEDHLVVRLCEIESRSEVQDGDRVTRSEETLTTWLGDREGERWRELSPREPSPEDAVFLDASLYQRASCLDRRSSKG